MRNMRYLILVVAAICFGPCLSTPAFAQTTTATDEADLRFKDYEEKVQALLKTRLPEEKQFVTAVMQKVREGKIPERLVETSYKWALNKHPDSNYPFVYFERVLRIQATKLKIELPEFDYETYRKRVARGS